MATQSYLCQLPILQEKRDLATRPMQPDDVQRIVAHIVLSVRLRTRLRLLTKLRPHFPTLETSAIECRTSSTRFLKTSTEKKGGTDVSIEEGAEGLTARHRRRLLLNQEAKEVARRPVLPWHIPLLLGCAQTPTIHRIPFGPNALPYRLLPQTLKEANSGNWRTVPPQNLEPKNTPCTNSPRTSNALSSATIGIFEVLFTKC